MNLTNYLTVFRRRLPVILMALGVGLVVTWVTLPPPPQAGVPRAVTYTATATVVQNPAAAQTLPMSTVALYTTAGEVPIRAAKRLGYTGEPLLLARGIAVAVGPDQRTVTISRTSDDGRLAARTVNVFADELVAYFASNGNTAAETQLRNITKTIRDYASRISALDEEIAAKPNAVVLRAQRDGLQAQYQSMSAQAAALRSQLTAGVPLTVLQPGVALPVEDQSTLAAATASGPVRMLLGGLIGLLLGLAVALVVERIDSRLRTREETEGAFELPVLAEIPTAPRSRRRQRTILSGVEPGSATAEAYRALRSSLLLLRPGHQEGRRVSVMEHGTLRDGTVILVTSPRPGEGKTTTVANLAIVLAESGRSVLVLSLDLRNPSIEQYFDIPSVSGISDLLLAGHGAELENVLRDTEYPGVRVAASGQTRGHHGALLSGVRALIDQARELADIVLIDSPPVLTVSDALDVSPHVDAALVVVRAKRTTTGHVLAAKRLLSRLSVPVLGTVLIGGEEADHGYGYGGGYGYGYGEEKRRRRSSRSEPEQLVAAEPLEEHTQERGGSGPG